MAKQAQCSYDERGNNSNYALANVLTNHDLNLQQLQNDDKVYNDLFNPDSFLPLNNVSINADSYDTAYCSSSCDYFSEKHFNSFISTYRESNIFSTLHLNIRSLPKNYDNFYHYLSSLNHVFSIIALTETWLTEDINSLFEIAGYSATHRCRGSRGGGVSLYVRKGLDFKQRTDLEVKFQDCNSEAVFLEVQTVVLKEKKKVIIGCIYRPPNTNINEFKEGLLEVLEHVDKENKPCYLLGDFNINLLNEEIKQHIDDFMNLLSSNYFYPLINKPTRITSKSSTLIDNIFTNAFSNVTKSGILYTDISDHMPVFQLSVLCGKSNMSEPKKIPSRRFNEKNINTFREMLAKLSWEAVYEALNVNIAYDYFFTKFYSVFDQCLPHINNSKKNTAGMNKPWFTTELRKSALKKNKLYKKYIQSPTPLNYAAYKSFRNKYNHFLRNAKREYYSDQFRSSTNNIRSTWDNLKELLNMKHASSPSPAEFQDGEVKITEPPQIANKFNDFFVNVGPCLAKHIGDTIGSPTDFISKEYVSINVFEPVKTTEVLDIIMSLKNTSAGHDEIPASLIKKVASLIIDPLTLIFSMSLESGIIPQAFKIAKVIPLFKSDDPTVFSNYRPISILPCFSKILEKLVYSRIMKHLTTNDILFEHQFGFRKNYSTYMALLFLREKITAALEKNEYTLGIFLDLSKAFDTVNYEILLSKMSCYGFRKHVLQWIANYLHNREQFVVFNGVQSQRAVLKCGVPQGSILGPLLFLIYVNDLVNASSLLSPIVFADDTNLLVTDKNFDSLIAKANTGLFHFSYWFKLNKLSLNVKKSNFIIFRNKNKNYNADKAKIYINDSVLAQVSSAKFLGIYIDEKLCFKNHCEFVCKKVSKSLGIIKRVKQHLKKSTLLTLYYSLIYSHISYCNIIWASTYSSYLQAIHRCQKSFVRIATNSSYLAPTKPLFKQLQLLTIYEVNKYQTGVLMYKVICLPASLPNFFPSYFEFNSHYHTHSTRRKNDLHIPFCRTSVAKFSFVYQGAVLWNDIKHFLESSFSINTFKTKFKQYLQT